MSVQAIYTKIINNSCSSLFQKQESSNHFHLLGVDYPSFFRQLSNNNVRDLFLNMPTIIFIIFCVSSISINAQEPVLFSSKGISDAIWSPLTEIEINTLSNTPLARNGDPDTLLALAIMASGDTRSKTEFARIKDQVQRFITRIKPGLAQEKNIWRKGFQLYTAMHDEFFLANSSHGELRGYKANQSQLTQIFRNKTYNCISSSILYLILARYFDLLVEGVILPSHSFVQLTTPKGQIIEIETTSKTGYGIRHNSDYYQKKAPRWSRLRNLSPGTYEDYLNRKIVSPYHLIADNMNHQHTAPTLMQQADRYRLQELRGWLLPDDPQAQLFRLYVFNNELIKLKEQNHYAKARKLIKTAEKLIAHYIRMLNSQNALDSQVYSIISYIYSTKAEIAIAEKDYKSAISNYNKALRWVREQPQTLKLQQNIAIIYLNQGNSYFSKQDYSSAIGFYEQALYVINDKIKNYSEELRQKIDHNIASAYWNMSVPYLNSGDSYSAFELLNKCRVKHPHLRKCTQGVTDICRSYSLSACQN